MIDDENGIFSVKGASGKDHNISFGLPSCSCRDWITWHLSCKHFFAIIYLPIESVESNQAAILPKLPENKVIEFTQF